MSNCHGERSEGAWPSPKNKRNRHVAMLLTMTQESMCLY